MVASKIASVGPSSSTELLDLPSNSWLMRDPSVLNTGPSHRPLGWEVLASPFRASAYFTITASHKMAAFAAFVADNFCAAHYIGVAADLSVAGFCQGVIEAVVGFLLNLRDLNCCFHFDGTFLKRNCRAGSCHIRI